MFRLQELSQIFQLKDLTRTVFLTLSTVVTPEMMGAAQFSVHHYTKGTLLGKLLCAPKAE